MPDVSLHIVEDTQAGTVGLIATADRVQAIISHEEGDLPRRMCSALVSEFSYSQDDAESMVSSLTSDPEPEPARRSRRRASKSE